MSHRTWLAVLAPLALFATAGGAWSKPEVALFVKSDGVNLRSGPGQQHQIVDSLGKGTEVRIRAAEGYWRQVYVPSTRRTGWVAHWLLSETPPPGIYREIAYINTDSVNLREGPGTAEYARVGILYKGERVEIIAYHEQWRKIRVPSNGEVGWVAAWLLKGGDGGGSSTSSGSGGQPSNLRYVKVEDFLHLRAGPSVRDRSLARLDRGQRVYLIKIQDKWCQVKVHGTQQVGWVHRDYLSDTPLGPATETLPAGVQDLPPAVQPQPLRISIPAAQSSLPSSPAQPQPMTGEATIPNGLVNIRSGPGTTYPVIGQAAVGTHFVFLEQANDWFHVRFDSGFEGWLAGWLITPVAVPVASSGPTAIGNAIAQEALRHLGKPYSWGKAGPDRFDCSGLVKYCLARVGINDYPRRTFEQVKVGRPVSADQLIPGDIVFFANTYTRGVSHVGIYVGNGQFVHAPQSGEAVRAEPLTNRAKSFYCARRPY